MFKCLLFRNYEYDESQTVHECSLDGLLQILGFLLQYEIQNGGYGRTQFHIGSYGKNVSKRFSETTWTIETKLPKNDHWKVLYKVCVFYANRKSKMAAITGHRLTLDHMGKCSNAFSETTNRGVRDKKSYLKILLISFFCTKMLKGYRLVMSVYFRAKG